MTADFIRIGSRGSELALWQAHWVRDRLSQDFPALTIVIDIIKTKGDKVLDAPLSRIGDKGLFTREIERELLDGSIDLAVHSLKDLPTELPAGLKLGAVAKRADVRDVLIYRDAQWLSSVVGSSVPRDLPSGGAADGPRGETERKRGFAQGLQIEQLPANAVVATSSTRRRAQLLARHAGIQAPDIRGNVATRMRKLAENPGLDATILALAGLTRLQFTISEDGKLHGNDVPEGLLASVLPAEVMLPCVGQGAIGIEIRENDELLEQVCRKLNHHESMQCVMAERAFLSGMGGGCQSPVGAYAEIEGDQIRMRVVSFADGPVRRGEARRPIQDPVGLGQELASQMKHKS